MLTKKERLARAKRARLAAINAYHAKASEVDFKKKINNTITNRCSAIIGCKYQNKNHLKML